VHDTTAVNLQSIKLAAVPLERDIVKLLIFDVIGAFNLDNIPGLIYSRVKDVQPAVGAYYRRSQPQITAYAVPETPLSQ